MKKVFLYSSLALVPFLTFAQTQLTNKKGSEYQFTVVKNIESTSVQNQGSSGTCWSFSSLSFFESELIRMKKGKDFNLSEMFVVHCSYPLKAENYIRMHGHAQFGEGGEFTDPINVLRKFGMVPQDVYNGKVKTGENYNHHDLDSILLGMAKEIASSPKTIDPDYKKKFEDKLDELLGKIPEEFEYKGKKYTPQSYAKELGINPDNYVFISSFTHHPFYSKFVLEIPDNWGWDLYNNVKLDEMMQTIDNALTMGYGVAWAADVSEPGFKFKEGLALLPEKPVSGMTEEEKKNLFVKPVPQLKVTQENRQTAFDNFETQDDHAMHITGIVKDQNGKKYYIVKNSWGKNNECDGYFYATEEYVRMKTTSIMVHKKTIPKALSVKLGIKQL
ncbi:MAG: aminopeptidase [Bacteroidia bacterium]|nr:aminopeptidase [Bacteroidia bacterium]